MKVSHFKMPMDLITVLGVVHHCGRICITPGSSTPSMASKLLQWRIGNLEKCRLLFKFRRGTLEGIGINQ